MPPSIDLMAFANFCGPQAICGLLARPGRGIILATGPARRILAVQTARGAISAPGTSLEDVAIVLDQYGLAVEPFDPATAEPMMSAAAFLDSCRNAPPRSSTPVGAIRELIEASPAEQQATLWDQHLGRYAEHMLVREWLRRPGTWLLAARGVDDHWLAVRDGRVLAGDDEQCSEWGERRVRHALRVFQHEARSV